MIRKEIFIPNANIWFDFDLEDAINDFIDEAKPDGDFRIVVHTQPNWKFWQGRKVVMGIFQDPPTYQMHPILQRVSKRPALLRSLKVDGVAQNHPRLKKVLV